MQSRIEHEFTMEQEDLFISLSESLYRFGLIFGVLGLGVTALGITVEITGAYGGGIAGPAIAITGLAAAIGGFLFLRPRAGLDRIASTRGRDITNLVESVESLTSAHRLLRLVLLIFVLARTAALLAAGAS